VEHGTNINKKKKNSDDTTLLFKVCDNGNEPIVEYLVDHGADVNRKAGNKSIPIFYACSKRCVNMVKYLVEHRANINKQLINSGGFVIQCILEWKCIFNKVFSGTTKNKYK